MPLRVQGLGPGRPSDPQTLNPKNLQLRLRGENGGIMTLAPLGLFGS